MSEKDQVTTTEAIILHLLTNSDTPMYGLEMVKAQPRLKRGTIYVLLGRLEDKKFVKAKMVEPKAGEQGPARRQYRITASGARALQAWKEGSLLGFFTKGLGVSR